MRDMSVLRQNMVRHQIAARGVTNEKVLDGMRMVPREAFLPDDLAEFAYDDTPLPIEEGQTMSQPYIVALMTEALGLEGHEKVLEIGTGSGYQTAVLAELARVVYTVEVLAELSQQACATLHGLGYQNIHFRVGDGRLGWPEEAPFDGILVAAAPLTVPPLLRAPAAPRKR